MKLIKVKIIKQRGVSQTNFIYPPNYNEKKIAPIKYENKGESIEYMIAHADDDLICEGDITEINEVEAETEIISMTDSDKDLNEEEKAFEKQRNQKIMTAIKNKIQEKKLKNNDTKNA